MFLVKKFKSDNYQKELSNKKELRDYDIMVKYTNKSFVDYLGPTSINSMPFEFFKKDTWNRFFILNMLNA